MDDKNRAPQWGDKPMGVTQQEYVSTVVAVLLMGTLLGWAIFGSPNLPNLVFSSGSVAEWIAALGTWVIGAGAWKYARDNHRHQVRDRTERKLALLSNVAEKARRLSNYHTFFETFDRYPPEKRKSKSFSYVLGSHRDGLSALALSPEEAAALDAASIFHLHNIELEVRFFRENAAYAITCADGDGEFMGDTSNEWLGTIIKRTANLAAECRELLSRVSAAQAALGGN